MFQSIAVAAAMERELSFLRSALDQGNHDKRRLTRGSFCGKTIYLLRTGIGPLKTVSRLEELRSQCAPQCIFSIGCAGALVPSLRVGDVVLSQTLVDDCQSGSAWESDSTLVNLAADCCKKHGIRCSAGRTVSTNIVAATPIEKQSLAERYGALAVDMESAQVASWAVGLGIPMLAIRVISDLAEDCLPPEMAGLFDRNGKIRMRQSAKVFVSTPSSVFSLYRFKKKFDRSLLVLARIMLPFLESL